MAVFVFADCASVMGPVVQILFTTDEWLEGILCLVNLLNECGSLAIIILRTLKHNESQTLTLCYYVELLHALNESMTFFKTKSR